jgi:hypothetical protein
MRVLLTLLILIVLVLIILVATGIVNLRQTPDGTIAVDTREVEVGTTTRQVEVPVIGVRDRQPADAQPADDGAPIANAQ